MNDRIKRISRLTAILTQLQAKKIVSATSLAKKHNVSVRTIYRDIYALEQSGVPVVTEEGKGFSLMAGYRIPPVTFTENEANALITAEKIILKNKDLSLRKEYQEAIAKIKAILDYTVNDKTNLLSKRILVKPQLNYQDTSSFLTNIQSALTEFRVIKISYHSVTKNETLAREVEPFALYNNTQETWNLIAYCRLRGDFRLFRLDRILAIAETGLKFKPHKITLEQYVEQQRKKYFKPLT